MNIVFVGLIICATLVILFILRIWIKGIEEKSKPSTELIEWLKHMGSRMDASTQSVDKKLTENMKMFNERLDKAAYVISAVQKNIGEFSEIGRSMKELQEFLNSPKLRGNIGEHILKELLQQYFPPETFSLQYTFKTGHKVDAVIRTTQGIISIDSKFPIDNFKKLVKAINQEEKDKIRKEFENDVKKHVTDIAKKYILVTEGTVDYALMYIPSEAVFYEIINSADIYDYAGKKRVLPVSPMSFYAYIKAILMSYEGQKIQTKAKEILEILQSIKKDYEKSEDALNILNKHITNAYNQTSMVSKNFLSLGQKLTSTNLLSRGQEDLIQKERDPVSSSE